MGWLVIGLSFGGALTDSHRRHHQPDDFIPDLLCGATVGPLIVAVTGISMVAEHFDTDWRASVARVEAKHGR